MMACSIQMTILLSWECCLTTWNLQLHGYGKNVMIRRHQLHHCDQKRRAKFCQMMSEENPIQCPLSNLELSSSPKKHTWVCRIFSGSNKDRFNRCSRPSPMQHQIAQDPSTENCSHGRCQDKNDNFVGSSVTLLLHNNTNRMLSSPSISLWCSTGVVIRSLRWWWWRETYKRYTPEMLSWSSHQSLVSVQYQALKEVSCPLHQSVRYQKNKIFVSELWEAKEHTRPGDRYDWVRPEQRVI